MPETTLMFGLPLYESVPALAFPSFLKVTQAVPGAPWLCEIGTNVSFARNRIVEAFLRGEDEFLVLMDADMQFEPEDVGRLVTKLENHPGSGALAAYYVKRDGSGLPVCNWKNGKGWILDKGREQRVERHLRAQELAYVDSFGGGLLVTSREALEKVGSPWFEASQQDGYFEGNDTYYCRRLQEEGFTPAVDFETCIGHVGPSVFRARSD